MHRIQICCCSITDCAITADIRPWPLLTAPVSSWGSINVRCSQNPRALFLFVKSLPSDIILWYREMFLQACMCVPFAGTLEPQTGSATIPPLAHYWIAHCAVEFQQP